MAGPTDIDVQVRGLTLRARVRGPDGAPPCVLLHGWLDHKGSFDRLAPLLHEAAQVRTIALDWRGHGDSQWCGAGAFYHLIEHVGDLGCALDALGIREGVRVVGHSLGATVGLLYAGARPGRVAHLTMLDGSPIAVGPSEVPERLTAWIDELQLPRARRLVKSAEDATERLLRFNPRLSREAAEVLAAGNVSADPAQGGALAWKWDPLLRAHSPLPVLEDAVQAVVARVTAPVLAIRAEQGFVPEEGDFRARFHTLPYLRVETIAGTSHHLHLEKPKEIASLIAAEWAGRSRG